MEQKQITLILDTAAAVTITADEAQGVQQGGAAEALVRSMHASQSLAGEEAGTG